MNDFSKYLDNKEELANIFKTANKSYRLYFNLFLLLIAFFVLYPIWRAGRQGFWLWLAMVVLIINNIIKELIAHKNLYLLTDKRLIYLKAVNMNDFKVQRYLYLEHIESLLKYKEHSICLLIDGKKYYITDVYKRDLLYDTLEIYLKNQNLV